ncbi:MAG: NnrU family protein [Pseudomonadota bacterium]
MLLIIIGLIIWVAAHLLRSCAKGFRESLQQKFGNGSKGIIGVVILVSLILMIIGYRSAEFIPVWSPPVWFRYLNNLLMFVALYMYLTTATQPGIAFVFGSLKHPQLAGFKLWAIAHLLVNGNLAAIILFGGLLIWAVIQIIIANRSVSLVDRNTAPIASPWVHLAIVIAVFVAIALVHNWIGVYPFAR